MLSSKLNLCPLSQCSVLIRPPCSVVSFSLSPLSWASHCRVVSTEASRDAQPIPPDRRRELPESQGGPEPSSLDAQPVPSQALAGTPPPPRPSPHNPPGLALPLSPSWLLTQQPGHRASCWHHRPLEEPRDYFLLTGQIMKYALLTFVLIFKIQIFKI